MQKDKGHSTLQRDRSQAKQKLDRRRARVLGSVVDELELGHGVKAAQLFRDGLDHGLFPAGNGLAPWLTKEIGKDAASKLVAAYAQFPCFYCKEGLETCETCGGRGIVVASVICEACAGLGAAPCGFCDGSGYVTNNIVPTGLRLNVLATRAKRACEQVHKLLRKPVPRDDTTDPLKAAKRCAQQFLALNRPMGVFENTVVVSKEIARTHPNSAKRLAKIVGVCCREAILVRDRFRELAKRMGDCSRQQAKNLEPNSQAFKRAKQGAAFYTSLSESQAFAETPLDHPHLWRAIARLSRQKRARNASRTRRE